MGGLSVPYAMVKALVNELSIKVPVILHLDHGSYEGAKKAIEVGYESVMFDGSHLSFAENFEKSKELKKLTEAKNVTLEVEVGTIGGEEDGIIGNGDIANPAECKQMADLNVDYLAAGIGNVHGEYPAD
ncbi:unnamed protein product [Didymodactylos carnosus]|uniref:Fructose-bisphosphate aldolase n=1 Tax=Didymodactylos carnosus TaxID=1234261 RepID=A0A8S2GQT5_9BILA|nr:unnamed protein product [Didymodactylos carnosus]CAF3540298.1 unnamed protein product [Didymodactylos carnosus]